jgi:hypothetical protein
VSLQSPVWQGSGVCGPVPEPVPGSLSESPGGPWGWPACGEIMSTLVMRRVANILNPLRRSMLDKTKIVGFLNQSTSVPYGGLCFATCRNYQLKSSPGLVWGTFPLIRPSKANNVCSRNSRSLTSEVASVSPSQTTEPLSLRAIRSAAAKVKVEKVLHQAQHHTYPRAKAMNRKFKTSTKKLKLVAKLVRRARVDAALMQLALSPKRVSKVVRRCIYAAKFNAANNHGHVSINVYDIAPLPPP